MGVTRSFYHGTSGIRSPYSIHIIGLGKSGAQFINAVLKSGYFEDNIRNQGSRVSALALDIGERDLLKTRDMMNNFKGRMKDCGIAGEKTLFRTIALPMPAKDELFAALKKYPEYLKKEYPNYHTNPNYRPWIPYENELPAIGKSIPRAYAKAIYGKAYYEDKVLDQALSEFAENVRSAELPPLVYVVFGLAGGTGSGMVMDLARHLTNVKLGRTEAVCGIGFLPNTGDPEENRGANLYPVFNELDLMVDPAKNQAVVSLWGDMYRNPFTDGFLMVPTQPAWERLCHYSPNCRPGAMALKATVTGKFVDDTLARFLTEEDGRFALRPLNRMGVLTPPHESVAQNEKSFTMFTTTKFLHPAVAVAPGQGVDAFRKEIVKWIDRVPEHTPLRKGFHTDCLEGFVYAPRGMWTRKLNDQLGETLARWVDGGLDNISLFDYEAFDHLTAYVNSVIPGLSKTDITYYSESRNKYEQLKIDDSQKVMMHSYLLEVGMLASEPSTVEGQAGKYIFNSTGTEHMPQSIGVSLDAVSGRAPEAPDRITVMKSMTDGLVPAMVPTP